MIDKSVAEHPEHPLAGSRQAAPRTRCRQTTQNLAFDLGEHDVGISAVGVAVLDAFGRPVAVSIPAPTHRFNAERDALSAAILAFREKMRTIVGR